jgi:hypothetical protein
LTLKQINTLFEKFVIREHNKYRILGSFHGVKVPSIREMERPEDRYKDMTEEEKQLETERQMKQFVKAFGGSSLEEMKPT